MSKLFRSKKTETSKTEIDPQIYNRVLGNLQFAEQVAAIPYEPYRGMMVAPFTRDYMAGEAATRRIAQEGGFVPELEAAARSASGLMGFQPERIQAERVGVRGAAPTVQGASFLGQDLGRYMNPYEQAVIETGLEDLDRAERSRQAELGRRATAARAFGGSRQAVEAGIAAGEAARERNRFITESRARAFREAAALREADVGREQQAALANQAAMQDYMRMGLTAEQANQQAMLDAAARNQAADLQAAEFQLGAGRQLADFGQLAQQNRYGAASALMGIGTAQQQLYQQFLNAQREEDLRRQQFPLQQLAIRQGAVSASPYNVTQTGTVTSRPSYWDMAGRVASAFFPTPSDENMKVDIRGIKNPLDKVNRLKGIEFEWADGYESENSNEDDEETDMSVSAQDVEKVMPEAVARRESDGMRHYSMPQMIGLLTEAVKELDKKVEGGKRRRKA